MGVSVRPIERKEKKIGFFREFYEWVFGIKEKREAREKEQKLQLLRAQKRYEELYKKDEWTTTGMTGSCSKRNVVYSGSSGLAGSSGRPGLSGSRTIYNERLIENDDVIGNALMASAAMTLLSSNHEFDFHADVDSTSERSSFEGGNSGGGGAEGSFESSSESSSDSYSSSDSSSSFDSGSSDCGSCSCGGD